MTSARKLQIKMRGKTFGSLALGLLIGITSTSTAIAQPTGKQVQPRQPVYGAQRMAAFRIPPRTFQPDELLIMPAKNVSDAELDEALAEANCKVAGQLGKGAFRVIVVKTEKGKIDETEAKLRKDYKHIGLIQKNYKLRNYAVTPNDPIFKNGGDVFLASVRAPKAWNLGAMGAGQTIAIIDSGSQANTADLAGKCDKGYDSTTLDAKAALFSSPIAAAAGLGGGAGLLGGLGIGIGLNLLSDAVNPGGQTDKDPNMKRRGHGTETATVAAGAINGLHGVGVAPNARIYPIHDGDDAGDDLAIMAGYWHLMSTPGTPRIVNISQGPLMDPSRDPILHFFFVAWHEMFGGITFVSAGNDSQDVGGSQLSYLNVVSAVDGNNHFDTSYSNFGGCVTFAAPGTVDSVDKFDADAEGIQGTSFSSPTCAGVAALIWGSNPSLSNKNVEWIMKSTAFVPSDVATDASHYGFGIPDAEAAVKKAMGI